MKLKALTGFMLLVILTVYVQATTLVIQVANFSFSPNLTPAHVGDTIKWMWVSGTHTTTSTTVPVGAQTWDAPLDLTHTSFTYIIAVAGQYNYKCTPHETFGMTGVINVTPIGITPISGNLPEKFGLYQNFPNPFNPTTKIKFDIPSNDKVKLTVYNVIGGDVVTLVNGVLQAGAYFVEWDASNIPSGTYFYKLETSTFSDTRKLVLIK